MANQFQYTGGPSMPGNAYGNAGGDLQSLWGQINKDVQKGRPGAMDWLFQTLNSLGQVEGANLNRHQYETMAPYMTDQAQQGRDTYNVMRPYMTDQVDWQREQNTAARPYLADQYEASRAANQRTQEEWQMYKPMRQNQLNWMNQQWDNQYLNPSLLYGAR